MRTQLWPIPGLSVAAAVVLGVALTQLDASIDDRLPVGVAVFLFGGSADAARSVLVAVAGSLITVTSLTFSLTVVTLQLASSQFSPRLLRTFTRDRVVHATLALFLATFVYSLTVLRTVRTESVDQAAFVPRIAVTLAYLLAVASVLGLVFFLAHLVREIRVETMLRKVNGEALETLDRVLADPPSEPGELPVPGAHSVILMSPASGFLTALDEHRLFAVVEQTGTVLLVDRAPGDTLVAGTPAAFAWPLDPARALDADDVDALQDCLASALTTEFERTAAQDIGFGLQQLVDVATKALSPGINDPTTAVHALSAISALLCDLAGRDLGPRVMRDDEQRTRVGLRRPDFDHFLELATARPSRYGRGEPDVLAVLFDLLREVAWCACHEHQRRAIRSQLQRLDAIAMAEDMHAADRARMRLARERVADALDRRWAPVGDGHS